MAEYALIDAYLEVVARRLEHRKDAAELRDELADHLLESTHRARTSGLDPESAQRSTLDRFGDPHIVAAMLAAVPTKGIDMVQALSRAAGILAIIAAVMWVAVIFAGSFGLVSYLDRTWSPQEYLWQSIVQAVAVLITGIAVVAVNLRFTGRVDALTAVVIGAMFLAFFFSFGFAWAFLSWGVYFAAGLAITIARISREPAARGTVAALLIVIVPVLLVIGSFVGLQTIMDEASQPRSTFDEDRLDLALFIAQGVVCVLVAAGLAILGFRLRKVTAILADRGPAVFA